MKAPRVFRQVCTSNHLPSISAMVGSAAMIFTLSTPFATVSAASDPLSFFDDFESRDTGKWDYTGEWGSGSAVYVTQIGQMGSFALYARADKKSTRVGKAYLTKNMGDAYRGDQVELKMDVYFGYLPTDNASTYVADIECRKCGWDKMPGIRLLIDQNRHIRVNRDKLKVSGEFKSIAQVPINKKFRLTLRLTLGEGSSGKTQVLIGDKVVIEKVGTTMPVVENFQNAGINLTSESFDYVQAGITANSHNTPVTGYFDNVSIVVSRSAP